MTLPTIDEWLMDRKSSIGGSELADLFGEGYSSNLAVYADKTSEEVGEQLKGRAEWGMVFELPIAQVLCQREGWEILGSGERVCLRTEENPHAHATNDFYVFDPERGKGILEIKQTQEHWDELPTRVDMQTRQQFSITRKVDPDVKFVDVGVLVGMANLFVMPIEQDDEKEVLYRDEVNRFWTEHVEALLPPLANVFKDSTKKALLKCYPTVSVNSMDLPPALFGAAEDSLEQGDIESAAKKRKQAARYQITEWMLHNNVNIAVMPDGYEFVLSVTNVGESISKAYSYHNLRRRKWKGAR